MSKFTELLEIAVFEAMKTVLKALKDEYVAEGHNLTSTGLNSMQAGTESDATQITGYIKGEQYLVYVDSGVPAGKVKYPISVMIRFFKLLGKDEKEAKRAAWATRAVHQREGIPSRGSYAFSSNGRRTGFIKAGLDTVKNQIKADLEKTLQIAVDFEIAEASQAEAVTFEF